MSGTATSDTAPQPVAARYVGTSVKRKEDRRLITGHGLYVDDVATNGMLHAAFVRSDFAKARITGIDTSAAKELPGVAGVFTWADFDGRFQNTGHAILGEAFPVPAPLAINDVRFVGDVVAIVVADSRYIAEDACELIEVDYDGEEPIVDYSLSAADTEHIVHRDWGLKSNTLMAVPFTPSAADLDDVFASAAHVVECTIEQNRYIPVPMETRGLVADWNPGRGELDLVCATQSVHEARNFFARYLGISEGAVRCTARDVGGGFGQKMLAFREECAVVLAAQLLGRPVKWIEDRRENLIAASHSRNELGHLRMAIDADGTIQAITIDHVSDIGAYPPCPAGMIPGLLPGPYRIPRLGFSTSMVWTNTAGKGAYRGPWMFETTAREMALDYAAAEIGMDPVELRRKNLLSAEELPFTSPGAQVFEEITPGETFEQALEMLDYDAFRREQAAAREQGRYLGVGVGVYVEPTAMASSALYTEGASVRVEASGKVVAYLGTTSHGQSIETTMAQVVADALGVAYDDVTVVQADSQSTPYGVGTGGSRTAVIAGGAARQATEAVREKVVAIAAHAMEANPDDLEINDSVVSVRGTPSRSMTMKQIATLAYRDVDQLDPQVEPGLEANVRFRPGRFPTWSNATHICVVEVDNETWIPKILRYIVSEDCGRMINPTVVEGQIAGGVVQGIGGVVLEDFVYDADGNPLTTTFMDYLLPTAAEIPDIEIGHIETASTTNPGGFKGLGEGGAIGSHAAVANAIGDALAPLGVRVTKTPLGPKDIFDLVTQAKEAVRDRVT